MRKGTRITGAALATAVALMFVGNAMAAESSSAAAAAAAAQVKCVGGNSCKGKSACQSASSSCKGQNACKGKGYVMASNEKDCKGMGGKVEK